MRARGRARACVRHRPGRTCPFGLANLSAAERDARRLMGFGHAFVRFGQSDPVRYEPSSQTTASSLQPQVKRSQSHTTSFNTKGSKGRDSSLGIPQSIVIGRIRESQTTVASPHSHVTGLSQCATHPPPPTCPLRAAPGPPSRPAARHRPPPPHHHLPHDRPPHLPPVAHQPVHLVPPRLPQRVQRPQGLQVPHPHLAVLP